MGSMLPPPPPGDDKGFALDELSSQLSEIARRRPDAMFPCGTNLAR